MNHSSEIDMIIDFSETKKIIVNHLPSDCIILKIETHNYKLNEKIKLVIDFTLNKNKGYKIHNFYFEVSDEITFVQADDKFYYLIDEETNYRKFRLADSFIRRNRYDIFTKEFFENYSL